MGWEDPATEKQVKYVKVLASKVAKAEGLPKEGVHVSVDVDGLRVAYKPFYAETAAWTKRQAGEAISQLQTRLEGDADVPYGEVSGIGAGEEDDSDRLAQQAVEANSGYVRVSQSFTLMTNRRVNPAVIKAIAAEAMRQAFGELVSVEDMACDEAHVTVVNE